MATYPHLIFPKAIPAERAKRNNFQRNKVQFPGFQQQTRRLELRFERLRQAMEKRRLELQDNSIGLQPEQALVLETVGSVQNFINAVKRIEGLEWLGEFEVDDITPEYGFVDENDPAKSLRGQLFLIMTDQRALQEVQRLFLRWQQNPDENFPRGLAPWKHAFTHLHTIRPWGAEDRIRETGIFEDWQFRQQHGQPIVPFEVELWFRENATKRQQAEANLHSIIDLLGGEITRQCVIPQIAYHGILGQIPVDYVADIIAQREVKLLQCEDIMFLRPIGQCAIRVSEDDSDTDEWKNVIPPHPFKNEPIVALLDGMPLANHQLLDGRLIVDDPDGYETAYQSRERVHGSAMASLICHGDLDESSESVKRPLYVRPIMKPRRGFGGQFDEAIPEDVLPLDLIHRAVRRLYNGEGDEPPAAPSVKVINLSIGDHYRPFDHSMSPWARLLDWLSSEYNVLFIVSAGNHLHDIELDVPRAKLGTMTSKEREQAVIEAIATDTRHRRLLSPAETINGLTVASIHADASAIMANRNPNLIDPFIQLGLPSPISAHGPGYRRAVKPDILLPGGRQLLQEKLGNSHSNATLLVKRYNNPPGQCVATPGTSGEITRTGYTRGTSNATALASYWVMSLFDVIEQMRMQSGVSLPVEYDTVLLKTLLVHSADWGEAASLYESILKNPQNSRSFKDYLTRFLGYGSANMAKVMACTDQRVTILGFGQLGNGEGEEYQFPLPPSLSAVTEKRRLTVSLAWLTPVNSMRQSYRVAHLWFDPKNKVTPDRICADYNAVQRGTVQHEVLEGQRAVDFQDGDTIGIKVNCRADAGVIDEPIRYGLAVTLEVEEGVQIPVYQEVQDRLYIRVPVQSSGIS